MKKHMGLIFTFIPWVIFSETYAPDPRNAIISALAATASTLLANYREIRKRYILPIASIIYFMLVAINSFIDFIPWTLTHPAALVNLGLALIIWLSIVLKHPFTLQYAKEEVDPIFWKNKLFITINYRLTFMWAIIFTISSIPAIFIPENTYDHSFFWNYGFNIVCIIIGLYLNSYIAKISLANNFWKKVKQLPPVDNPFLKNGYKPVHDEVYLTDLEVVGKIPEELIGRYLRNGPNPYFTPYTYTYPIDGDGMIHQIEFNRGSISYKNKFIMTRGLQDEIKAGCALFGGIELPIPADPRKTKEPSPKNTAAIHIIKWQDKLMALYEGTPAYLLDNQLNTIGEFNLPNRDKPLILNAHHRHDYITKQTYMCGYGTSVPLTVYEFDEQGKLVKEVPIYKKRHTMIHDFVITQNYLVFFDMPGIFSFADNDGSKPFLTYYPDQPVYIYLINRHNYSINVIKNIPSFFIYHFINAYEENNNIIIDFIYHEALVLNPSHESMNTPPSLYRGIIDLTKLKYTHTQIDDQHVIEFPNYNLQYTGQKYQYAYIIGKDLDSRAEGFNTLLKYDLSNSTYTKHNFGNDIELDEVTYMAKNNSNCEDDGYLMFFAYNKTTDTSDFIILDAKNINSIIAQVKLNRRVPHGLHGSFVNTLS